jgi:hypothetical protein
MIERRADWKHAEQSDARFFPTISPSAVGERCAGCPPQPSTIAPSSGRASRGREDSGILRCRLITQERRLQRTSRFVRKVPETDMDRAPKGLSRDTAQRPRALMTLVSKSGCSPGQQESDAKRDQRKSRPIRFDPKAARRSFRFQGVTGSPRAQSSSPT